MRIAFRERGRMKDIVVGTGGGSVREVTASSMEGGEGGGEEER